MLVKVEDSFNQIALVRDVNYDCHLKQYNDFLLREGKFLNRESLLSFWHWLLEQDYSPKTLNIKKQALKAGIKKTFVRESDSLMFISMLNEFFKDEIKSFKVDRTIYEGDTLDEFEIQELIEKAPLKISIIIETLAISGLRVSELLSLRIKKSSLKGNVHYFKIIGKGKKERTIYLSIDLVKRIKKAFNVKDFLFTNLEGEPFSRRYIHQEIHKYGEKILNKSIHPHTLRHSFATIKHQEGKSIKGISKYLGHSNTSITLDMYVDTPLNPEDVLG